MERNSDPMEACRLCPRDCGVNRRRGEKGFCRTGAAPVVARAALHPWEEPCLIGEKGSGTVFFSGCSLGCLFCQNQEIALEGRGKEISVGRLSEIFLELQEQGAANINLVTGEHFAPFLVEALGLAKREGLTLPVVYNSGGYEKVDTIKQLEGLVDVYLPDMKYAEKELAVRFARAPDYPQVALAAIEEMVRQRENCVFDSRGGLHSGVLVRHLILPGHTRNSRAVIRTLYEAFGDHIYLSLMNQYTPVRTLTEAPELNRRVTKREYEKVLSYALSLGVTQGFFQEGDTAEESFIPDFSGEGVTAPPFGK